MSPGQEKSVRSPGQSRDVLPQVQTPRAQPGTRLGVTYVEQESRDWCEALHMNQAQTDREVSFPGSNIEKPKKRLRKLSHRKSFLLPDKAKKQFFYYSVLSAVLFLSGFSLSNVANHEKTSDCNNTSIINV